MKIAFDHQIFGWQEYGGISRYAFELASELSLLPDNSVSIYSPLFVNEYLSSAPQQLRVHGFKVPTFKFSGRIYRELNSILVRPALSKFRPDIVHETYYSPKRQAPKSAKVVLTVYDMIHERFPEYFSKHSPTRREKAIAVARADHVICISEQTRQDLISFTGVSQDKISVVHLGFARDTSSVTSTEIQIADRPYILYVGNRTGHKNFKTLISAYASSKFLVQNYDLVCFGGGELTTEETDIIRKLGIPQKNIHHVFGNDSVLSHFYRNAKLFVYPSLYEGFGIPPLEAMSLGCPVVCSNISSIPEIVGDAALKCDPESYESIREAMEAGIADDSLRTELIQKGFSRVENFSWERCARETFDIYRRVLS